MAAVSVFVFVVAATANTKLHQVTPPQWKTTQGPPPPPPWPPQQPNEPNHQTNQTNHDDHDDRDDHGILIQYVDIAHRHRSSFAVPSRPSSAVRSSSVHRSFVRPSVRRLLKMNANQSLFVVRCSLFVVRCSLFDVRCSMFVVRCSMFVVWFGRWSAVGGRRWSTNQPTPPSLTHSLTHSLPTAHCPTTERTNERMHG